MQMISRARSQLVDALSTSVDLGVTVRAAPRAAMRRHTSGIRQPEAGRRPGWVDRLFRGVAQSRPDPQRDKPLSMGTRRRVEAYLSHDSGQARLSCCRRPNAALPEHR